MLLVDVVVVSAAAAGMMLTSVYTKLFLLWLMLVLLSMNERLTRGKAIVMVLLMSLAWLCDCSGAIALMQKTTRNL